MATVTALLPPYVHSLSPRNVFMIVIDKKTRSTAMLMSSVLFRSFLLGSGLLLLTCLPVLLLTDEIYALHSGMIDIPRPDYNTLLFGWLGNMKLLLLIFFLVPAIAIRWALKNTS